MILLRLTTSINEISVEVEGEANTLDEIREAWESFILSTYQVENGTKPNSFRELEIHRQNLTRPPVSEIMEVL